MTSWSHGYNLSAGYTYGFYRETAPDWIDFALSLRGVEPPRSRGGTPFRYLELGSGQGFGLCLLAAANPEGEFLGIDFSPEHTAHAKALAAELSLTNITFVEGDFLSLGEQWPADYGEFDYVTLHGIYSWVPEAVRRQLIAILSRATSAGAAVYASYNAMPGWASSLPFQHMLRLLEEEGSAKGMGAIEAGRSLFDKLHAAGSGVTEALPGLKMRMERTRAQPEAYLIQEYLHENWHPLWCSKVMAELAQSKLGLAATATLAENLLPQILPAGMQEVLGGHGEARIREDLIDCLINQTFRRDLYVRGVRRRHGVDVGWQECVRIWRANPAVVPAEVTISLSFGSITLKAEEIAPLLDAVGDGSRSLAEVMALPAARADPVAAQRRLVLLIHSGWLCAAWQEREAAASAGPANARVAALVAAGAAYRHVVAPRLGSGPPATDSNLLMLDAYLSDRYRFEEQGASMLKQRLDRLGRKPAKDGKPLTGQEEVAELDRMVEDFRQRTLPGWRTLAVID